MSERKSKLMTTEEKIAIGKRLREIREDKELSQSAFARQIEMSQATVNLTEEGYQGRQNTQPSKNYIAKVCQRFGVNKRWVYEGEQPKYLEQIDSEASLLTMVMNSKNKNKKRLIMTIAEMPDSLIQLILEYWNKTNKA